MPPAPTFRRMAYCAIRDGVPLCDWLFRTEPDEGSDDWPKAESGETGGGVPLNQRYRPLSQPEVSGPCPWASTRSSATNRDHTPSCIDDRAARVVPTFRRATASE